MHTSHTQLSTSFGIVIRTYGFHTGTFWLDDCTSVGPGKLLHMLSGKNPDFGPQKQQFRYEKYYPVPSRHRPVHAHRHRILSLTIYSHYLSHSSLAGLAFVGAFIHPQQLKHHMVA